MIQKFAISSAAPLKSFWQSPYLALVFLLLSTTACTLPYSGGPLECKRVAHSRPYYQAHDGFVLAADLVESGAECQSLFHDNLSQKHIVAITLHIENQGDRSIILQSPQFSLQLEGSSQGIQPLPLDTVLKLWRRSNSKAYLGLPLIFPYMMERRAVARFNSVREQDIRAKSLPQHLRIEAGDACMAYVLFFEIPKDQFSKLKRSPVLEVPAQLESDSKVNNTSNSRAGKSIQFLLSLG